MFTRLLKTLSVVVLIVVLTSSVSLAGIGGVSRGEPTMSNQSMRSNNLFWTVVLSIRPFAIV